MQGHGVGQYRYLMDVYFDKSEKPEVLPPWMTVWGEIGLRSCLVQSDSLLLHMSTSFVGVVAFETCIPIALSPANTSQVWDGKKLDKMFFFPVQVQGLI